MKKQFCPYCGKSLADACSCKPDVIIKFKRWLLKSLATERKGGGVNKIIGIERETEKAYLIKLVWAWTPQMQKEMSLWVPKSGVEVIEVTA